MGWLRHGAWLVVLAAGVSPAGAAEAPLIEAVKAGHREAVREMLREPLAVAAAEADGTTALHWAARADDLEMVRLLLSAGAPVEATTRHGVTPLVLAAINGSPAVARALLDAGASAGAVLPEGETVLMTAARTGRPEVVRLLVERGADVHAREHTFGETALIWASAENHPEAIGVLVAHGAEVNGRSARLTPPNRRSGQSVLPLGDWTPLMYAARQGALESVRALTALGADPDLTDPDGATALVLAIINAHYDVAKALLEAGADPNVVDTPARMGPLYAAIDMHRLAIGHGRPNPKPSGRVRETDIVRALLEAGADPNARLNAPIMQRQHTGGDTTLGEGATPFMRAAKSGDVAMMRLLLDAGADPALTLPNGSTALMFAAGLGWRDGSPLAPAYEQGFEHEAVEAIALCLEAGLDIHAANDAGQTALHAAVSGRASPAIVRALLAHGADPARPDTRGRTPRDLAAADRRGLTDIIDLLR
jgi:uncharacterized protein